MIDLGPLVKIVPIFAAVLISPGPDFMMISSMALSRGRIAGILASLGLAAGILVWVTLSIFGMGFVFAQMQWLITVVRLLGGAYLIYLAYQLWRASFKPQASGKQAAPPAAKRKNPFVVGFITNVTNPKALAFFTSIFALTLPPDTNAATQATIMAVMGVMPVLWFGAVTFCLRRPRCASFIFAGAIGLTVLPEPCSDFSGCG